jgi:hypothetical protein
MTALAAATHQTDPISTFIGVLMLIGVIGVVLGCITAAEREVLLTVWIGFLLLLDLALIVLTVLAVRTGTS